MVDYEGLLERRVNVLSVEITAARKSVDSAKSRLLDAEMKLSNKQAELRLAESLLDEARAAAQKEIGSQGVVQGSAPDKALKALYRAGKDLNLDQLLLAAGEEPSDAQVRNRYRVALKQLVERDKIVRTTTGTYRHASLVQEESTPQEPSSVDYDLGNLGPPLDFDDTPDLGPPLDMDDFPLSPGD